MDIQTAVTESRNIGQALTLIGRSSQTTNYAWLREQVLILGLDTSHWDSKSKLGATVTTDVLLCRDSKARTRSIRRYVLRHNLITYQCAVCSTPPTWCGMDLVLILDHINGIPTDHRLENLRFVCPNCNSQLLTFAGRNVKHKVPKRRCKYCDTVITARATACQKCMVIDRRKPDVSTKITWPDIDTLVTMCAAQSVMSVSRELGVSDTAVRKRLRKHAPVD